MSRAAFRFVVATLESLGEVPERSARALTDYALAVDVAETIRAQREEQGAR